MPRQPKKDFSKLVRRGILPWEGGWLKSSSLTTLADAGDSDANAMLRFGGMPN